MSWTLSDGAPGVSRRRFLAGSGGLLLAAGLGLRSAGLAAQVPQPRAVPVLKGRRFDLRIGYQAASYGGQSALATTVNNSLPAPILRWREGDTVQLRVRNDLTEDSSIHWHGMILPYQMDGVPGLSFAGIKPGQHYDYQFKVQQSGTYWYHSHSGWQEQTGLYGAIVIDPIDGDRHGCDREFVLLLSDWSPESPDRVYQRLKKMSHYYNYNERTLQDWWRDVHSKGVAATWRDRAMWNQMRMSDSDLADVNGHAYRYLMNGFDNEQGWMGLFKPGERIKLRIINGSAMSLFDIRIPGLSMKIVASDGQDIEPVTVDEFRIGTAETYDVIIEPKADSAYTVFAQSMDRSGYAVGWISPDSALRSPIPAMDPMVRLGHGDMGMGHGTMDHPSAGAGDAGHDRGAADGADHGGMNHGATQHGEMQQGGMSHSGMAAGKMKHTEMGHHGMNHEAMGTGALDEDRRDRCAAIDIQPRHAPSEFGPQVDMRAEAAPSGLDDPGIGLREHRQKYGRSVLRYSQLRNIEKTRDARDPEREIVLHLTGNMSRYMWSIDGIPFADAEPLGLRHKERVRIVLINDTMMTHPIHLHGLWSELESGDCDYLPRKHTVLVQPGSSISYRVTADAIGRWAYHCHLMYHMPGMMREVRVVPPGHKSGLGPFEGGHGGHKA